MSSRINTLTLLSVNFCAKRCETWAITPVSYTHLDVYKRQEPVLVPAYVGHVVTQFTNYFNVFLEKLASGGEVYDGLSE